MTERDSPTGGTLYSRLEVSPGASREEIVRAYRRLAHGAHPDTHPQDPDAARRFREITEAYDVLTDPDRRVSYDRLGTPGNVRVTVKHPPLADPPDPTPQPHIQPLIVGGPPTVIGLRPLSATGSLRAGPVRLEPNHSGSGRWSEGATAGFPAEVTRALFEVLDAWWYW